MILSNKRDKNWLDQTESCFQPVSVSRPESQSGLYYSGQKLTRRDVEIKINNAALLLVGFEKFNDRKALNIL